MARVEAVLRRALQEQGLSDEIEAETDLHTLETPSPR